MGKHVNSILCLLLNILFVANATMTIKALNIKESKLINKEMLALWNYDLNPSESAIKELIPIISNISKERKNLRQAINAIRMAEFGNPDIQRQLDLFGRKGDVSLLEERYVDMVKINHLIISAYRNLSITLNSNAKYRLNLEEIQNVMAKRRNESELKDLWISFHDSVEQHFSKCFENLITTTNDYARCDNLKHAGDIWLYIYDFSYIEQVQALERQFRPIYSLLHAHIRYKLQKVYGDVLTSDGQIPVHLLGSIFGDTFVNIYDLVLPYPQKNFVDVNNELFKQNYSLHSLAKKAEEYFLGLDFEPLPDTVWEKSIFVRPTQSEKVLCSNKACYFFDNKDFRVRFCAELNHATFIDVHDYLAVLHVASLVTHLPYIYQRESVPGYFTILARVLTIPIKSNKYLRKTFLINRSSHPEEVLNNLLYTALGEISAVAYYFLMESFRYKAFEGNYKNYNSLWWDLRSIYQGIAPPMKRGVCHFDADLKYTFMDDYQYLGNFYSVFMAYDIFREICISSGEYDINNRTKPLYQCELNKTSEAFLRFISIARLGRSIPWEEIQSRLLRYQPVSTTGFYEYYEPLLTWLKKENAKHNVYVGWKGTISPKRTVSFECF